MSKKEATITPNPKAAPTFGEGTITPAVLSAWENGCFMHFRDREVADDKQVMKAAAQIHNEVLSDWYHSDYARFDAMSWDDFAAAVRTRFLPKGWALSIYSDLFAAKQLPTDTFNDFVLSVERFNARLRNTQYRQSEANLRGLLIANMNEDLRAMASDPTLMALADYIQWKTAVANLDAQCLRNVEMINNLLAARSNNSSRTSNTASRSNKSSSQPTSSASSTALPKLTPSEKALLNDHQGCYKCRRFYAGHLAGGCPNGFPKPETYSPLTSVMAQKVRDSRVANKDAVKARTVATVDAHEQETIPDNVVAAVHTGSPLATTSGILGTGSDSEECVSPLFSRHTILRARIESPSCDSSAIPLLIDSGSSTVLIRRDVATRLQLRIRKLPEPYKLGNAWDAGESTSSEWVKLRVTLADNSWTSVTCRAIVVSSLCAPVILGKPFLESNCIVEDHCARSLVDKRSGQDLLDSSTPPPSAPQRPHERRETLRESRIHSVEGGAHVVAAVRHHVELLAFQERLARENVLMKTEFVDLFPDDIPHIDRLPDDVYHRFVLKDPNMVIARRQYDCPKKYREVWKKLLDQHLKAG
ncbi:hypothetical protein OH76DRAFT_1340363 [Lentinus brumalis]|uniref:Uncharacterized protein n=1 Tax=Lentinus brumalis TaxID=2498619 RepID=A0A371DPC7_9APHY|nr:hypothetical protein OH76DRAFT_1340363 [Polyporus brumalis]